MQDQESEHTMKNNLIVSGSDAALFAELQNQQAWTPLVYYQTKLFRCAEPYTACYVSILKLTFKMRPDPLAGKV